MQISAVTYLAISLLTLSVGAGLADEKSNFSVGLAAVGGSSIYSNVGSKAAVMPSISYKSKKIEISVQSGLSYKLFDDGKFAIRAAVTPRFSPYKSSSSLDLSGMKREMFYDSNLNISYIVSRGLTAKLGISSEVSNEFNGNAADLSFSQFIPISGQPFIITAGAKWFDANRANYYYGVNPSEVRDVGISGGRELYSPGSATLPYVSLTTFFTLAENTSLFANIGMNFLPTNIVDSPIVGQSSSTSTLVGLNYNF